MVSQIMPMKPFTAQSPMDLAFQTLVEGNFQERWDLAKVIPGFEEEAIAPLAKLLQHPDSELRWFAARILGELDHPQAIALLVELLATPEEEIQAIASKSLARLGEKNIPILTEKLADPATRLLAVQALSQIHSEQIVAPLLGVAGDQDERVRTRAIAALHSYPAPEIIPVFIKGLVDAAASVRREAVTGLGLIASRTSQQVEAQDLVNLLTPCLIDINLEVAQQAAIALRRVGTEAAVVSLGEFIIKDSIALPLGLQIEILRQLGWIGQSLALNYLQQNLDHNSPEVWLEIVTILGRVETFKPEACGILIKMLNANHPGLARTEIRQAIASSLGQLRESAGQDALGKLLKDSDRSVQLHSQFALKLLSADDGSD